MRSNDVAAEVLQELADLAAISGGYRVRAYEKAARSVAGCLFDLDTLDRKGLMAMPAVDRAPSKDPKDSDTAIERVTMWPSR
jgi:DNA polymerase (family X)